MSWDLPPSSSSEHQSLTHCSLSYYSGQTLSNRIEATTRAQFP